MTNHTPEQVHVRAASLLTVAPPTPVTLHAAADMLKDLLAENARLTDAVNVAQVVATKHRARHEELKAENARLREALQETVNRFDKYDATDALEAVNTICRAALAVERSEKV